MKARLEYSNRLDRCVTLHDQKRHHRLKQYGHVLGSIDAPGTYRKPAAFLRPRVIPPNHAANTLDKPIHNAARCAVNGDLAGNGPFAFEAHLKVSFAIEQSSQVAEIGADRDAYCTPAQSMRAGGCSSRFDSATYSASADTEALANLLHRLAGAIRLRDCGGSFGLVIDRPATCRAERNAGTSEPPAYRRVRHCVLLGEFRAGSAPKIFVREDRGGDSLSVPYHPDTSLRRVYHVQS